MPLPPGPDKTAADPGDQGPGAPAGHAAGNGELNRRLHGWRHPAILSAAGLSVAAGFAQFLVTSTLPDVAAAFGQPTVEDGSLAAQAGLSGTTLGIGLGIVRLASLGALPLSGLADRHGRRRVVLGATALGLALTAAAALSPSYWALVALVALSRPLLSTTNAIAGVVAAEETRTHDRAWAVGLVAAGYGIGAGIPALLRGVIDGLGFRTLFALCLVMLVLVLILGRFVEEPVRFDRIRAKAERARSPLARLPRHGVPGARLRALALAYFAITFMTGPAFTLLFLYGESVLRLPRSATALTALGAGPVGALGLLVGRWTADRFGRVRTSAIAHVLVAVFGALAYSGRPIALLLGYLATLFSSAAWGIPFGALSAELFPTSIRSTIAGALTAAGVLGAVSGLVVFGVLGDLLGDFGLAAMVVALLVLTALPQYRRLPETRHLELEESAPED